METSAAPFPAASIGTQRSRTAATRSAVLWGVAGLTALGVAVRFASLGLQSYHHDEVITAARVIPGSFIHMLREVKSSESNPPLYYVMAWGWAKVFGVGEVGLRSLSALLGAATVPVAYFAGRELASRRSGLIAAALVALNPMLIWYSQEARSYAALVFFGAVALVFFARALNTRSGRDLALWALASALALCSHYFAAFAIGIEGAWLLVALRDRWNLVLPALGAILVVALALIPLINAQVNPTHIGWIDHSPLPSRLWETGISFMAGETGHVIAEPPRERYALIPAVLLGVALVLVLLRGSLRDRRGATIGLTVGLGVIALATLAALGGKDYVVERNLLPALVPLLLLGAIGFGADRARVLGLIFAVAISAYWLAFDIHVTQTPNLQRPNFRALTDELGKAHRSRAIVTWKLAADPVQFYLHDGSQRMFSGSEPISEVDVVGKPLVAGRPVTLPPSFHPVQRIRLDRLTLTRYVAKHPQRVAFRTLHKLPTGFGQAAVGVDGLPWQRRIPPDVGLRGGHLDSVHRSQEHWELTG